jgi:chromate reductase, NAD(P)H dehydrogenase (quinone)
MTAPIRLLVISGSLRREAHSTAIARTLPDAVGDRAEVEVRTLNDVPPYNADDEGALPAGARGLKDAIAAADAVVWVSPEYNYGVPGVVKNAIDWASRPGFNSVLKGKPCLIVTSSPGATGGARAHAPIREALAGCLAVVIARPQVTIAAVDKKIRDGRLVDEASVAFTLEAVEALIAEARLRSPTSPT